MDAFDADVLIYAAVEHHPLGSRVLRVLVDAEPGSCVGSTALMTEVLIKPTRLNQLDEVDKLARLLARIDLRPADRPIAEAAVDLGARYGLKTVDAIHLATAVLVGADRFITNNRRDFDKDIPELDVTFPDDLPAAT